MRAHTRTHAHAPTQCKGTANGTNAVARVIAKAGRLVIKWIWESRPRMGKQGLEQKSQSSNTGSGMFEVLIAAAAFFKT